MLMNIKISMSLIPRAVLSCSKTKDKHTQIGRLGEKGGSIPWAGERYQMKSVSYSFSLLPPTLSFRRRKERRKERVAKVTSVLYSSLTHALFLTPHKYTNKDVSQWAFMISAHDDKAAELFAAMVMWLDWEQAFILDRLSAACSNLSF